MEVLLWDIDRLREYEHNPRVNDHAVEPLARFIDEFGFRVPIIAQSDGLVVDGHLRLKAARALGMVKVPVVLADDLSESQVKALRVGINKMADLAQFDFEKLAVELKDIDAGDVDVMLLGFDENELNRIMSGLATNALPDVDDGSTGDAGGKVMTCPHCGAQFDADRG